MTGPPADKDMRHGLVLCWVLRCAVFGEFLGHGVFALRVHPPWIAFFPVVGLSPSDAQWLMPVVGAIDVALAFMVLIRPVRAGLLWMAFWGLFTALLRPMSGLSVFEFVERLPNSGAPLALLILLGWPRSPREWFSACSCVNPARELRGR